MCSSSSHENLDSLRERVVLHVFYYIKCKGGFFNFSTCQWENPKSWQTLGTTWMFEILHLTLISVHD